MRVGQQQFPDRPKTQFSQSVIQLMRMGTSAVSESLDCPDTSPSLTQRVSNGTFLRRGARSARNGSLLIQMVIVMAGMTVMMTIVATIMFRLFRHEANVTMSSVESGISVRIARIFRNDVHAAETIEVSDDGKTMTALNESQRIVWSQSSEDAITRVRLTDATIEPSRVPGERFRITNVKAVFSLSPQEGSQTIATLIIEARSQPGSLKRNNVRPLNSKIVACVGLTH